MTQYFALHPATFKLDGGAMFGIIPKPLWEKKIPADELNRIHLALRVLLVKTKQRVILIDTGIGDYHDSKFKERFAIVGVADPLVQVLHDHAHISVGDVTDVVITHLHFDHVGGLSHGQQGQLQFLFPKAHVHVHRRHYEYSLNPTQRDQGSFMPEYRAIIEELDKEKRVIWHEGQAGLILKDDDYALNYRCSDGHTPWLLHPYDDKMIYMADLVPTSAHLPIPWVMGYDIAAGQTTKDKAKFYSFIAERGLCAIFEHDMQNWGAHFTWDGNAPQNIKPHASQGKPIELLTL